MSIKQEIAQIEPELLENALKFAAHVMNNSKAIKTACEEQGVSRTEGYAYTQLFTELGIMGETSIKNQAKFDIVVEQIKSTIPL